MKKADFDAAAWLEANQPSHGGRKCSICSSTGMRDRVNAILSASQKTGIKPTARSIHLHLVEAFKFNYTESSVINHLKRHVKKYGQ